MGIEKETFDKYGPTYLKDKVDWSNIQHQRAIAAALVYGVKVLERDRVKKRHGPKALAPPWWQSFGYDLVEKLEDPHDHSYFGAIFKLASPTNHSYVVAFRGTINRLANVIQDYTLDLVSTLKNLENRSRTRIGLEAVRGVAGHDNDQVWLAGHSLGAATAMVVGRKMIKHHGICLQTYLFSPPFPTLDFGFITDHMKMKKLGKMFRVGKSLATVSVVAVVNLASGSSAPCQDDNSFAVLSAWVPCIFINVRDPISSKYVRYFRRREEMERLGLGDIERVATRHSIRTRLSSSEASHLIPCAHLFVNYDDQASIKNAHGISQWWSQHVDLMDEYHSYT